MSISSESLENKLISALKTDDLWIQFLQCIGAELDSMRDTISLKKNHYDIEKQLEDGLIRIAKDFGYNPNLIIDNSLSMVKKEVESIPTRIRDKTTYYGYYLIFKQIGRIGDIYNYYWSGKKLIKAIKWQEIVDILNKDNNYSEPFISIIPDKNFSTISSSDTVFLDTNIYLDDLKGQWNWMLDENVEISPTKHLGIEYYPRNYEDFSDNPEYLMLSKYFKYLSVGVEYNRRLPIVPHCGLQLTSINYEGGGNNYFDTTQQYTIPKLKLNSVLGFEYNKAFTELKGFNLDDTLGLDELIKWYLDKDIDTSSRPSLNDFKYISCGDGYITTPSADMTTIFDFSKLIFFYTFNDMDNSYIIKDYSINKHNSEIKGLGEYKGQTKKVKGIIGKTVDFDGITSLKMKDTVDIISSDISYGFWINPNALDYYESKDKQCVVDFSTLKVFYTYKTKKLSYTIGNNIKDFIIIEHNSVNNIVFEMEKKTSKLKIFLNGTLVKTYDLTDTSHLGESTLYIGSDSNNEHKFVGIIDSMWMINKLHSEKELKTIYDNRLGILTQLGNRLATYELDMQHEGYADDRWAIIQSHVKANDVTNEFGFFAQKSMDTKEENVFSDGKNIKYAMSDEETQSYEDYSNFGQPLMQVYTSDSLDTRYLYSNDPSSSRTYYKNYIYHADTDTVELTEPRVITRNIQPTEYQYYSKVTNMNGPKKLIPVTYKGNTNFYPIKKEYFSLFYNVLAPNGIDYELIELKASQDGNFYNKETNEDVTGHINFETGEYTIGSLTERYTTQEVLINTSILPSFTCTLQGTPKKFGVDNTSEIKKGTLIIKYTISNNVYYAHDNGEGLVSGIGISNGTIDYSSRFVSLKFDNDIEGEVIANYTYLESLNMVEGSDTYFNYKVENKPITEIGLEDAEHNLLAYMNFPKVEFDTHNNHISAMFIIRKQS